MIRSASFPPGGPDGSSRWSGAGESSENAADEAGEDGHDADETEELWGGPGEVDDPGEEAQSSDCCYFSYGEPGGGTAEPEQNRPAQSEDISCYFCYLHGEGGAYGESVGAVGKFGDRNMTWREKECSCFPHGESDDESEESRLPVPEHQVMGLKDSQDEDQDWQNSLSQASGRHHLGQRMGHLLGDIQEEPPSDVTVEDPLVKGLLTTRL